MGQIKEKPYLESASTRIRFGNCGCHWRGSEGVLLFRFETCYVKTLWSQHMCTLTVCTFECVWVFLFVFVPTCRCVWVSLTASKGAGFIPTLIMRERIAMPLGHFSDSSILPVASDYLSVMLAFFYVELSVYFSPHHCVCLDSTFLCPYSVFFLGIYSYCLSLIIVGWLGQFLVTLF